MAHGGHAQRYFCDYTHISDWRDKVTGQVIRRGLRINCCTCNNFLVLPVRGAGTSVLQITADKMFRAKGWDTTGTRKEDQCPICIETTKEARVKARKERANETNVVQLVQPEPARPVSELLDEWPEDDVNVEAKEVEPVQRKLTPATRRIIFATIEQAYRTDDDGYLDGHSDQTVAASLDVPIEWVTVIRAENFGPEKSNKELEKLLKEIEQCRVDVQALLTYQSQMKAECERMAEQIKAVTIKQSKLSEIAAQLGRK